MLFHSSALMVKYVWPGDAFFIYFFLSKEVYVFMS